MVTKEHLQQVLTEISASAAAAGDIERVECVRCDVLSPHEAIDKYSAEVTTVLTGRHDVEYYKRYAGKWIKKFSAFTGISWTSGACVKRIKRLPYRIIYKCHNKSNLPVKPIPYNIDKNLQKLLGTQECQSHVRFKNRNPKQKKNKGTIITIVIDISYCRKKHIQHYFIGLATGDKLRVQKYCNKIEESSSSSDCSDPLVKIDDVYYEYFADGHTSLTAKMLHLLKMVCKYGDNDKVLSDQTKNPLMSFVSQVWRYYKHYIKDYSVDFDVIMSRKRTGIEKLGGLISYSSQDMLIIITPTMRRVLSSHELDEVIISSTEVSQGPAVTLLSIPSKIGALFFACVLHQNKTQEAYSMAFIIAKNILEKDCLKNFEPKTVIVDISPFDIARLAVESVFQKSKVLIAPWYLCCQAWIWLCTNKLSTKRYWHEAMTGFYHIMHATDSVSAHVLKLNFKGFEFFKSYLDQTWEAYKLVIWRSTANKALIELSIRLIQQFFISKCATFNILHICDIIKTLDKHLQNILLCSVHKKQPLLNKVYLKFLDKCELNTLKLELTSPHEFSIDAGYKLRSDTWCCDCNSGRKALYCEHVCKFMSLAEVTMELQDHERHFLQQMAGEVDANADPDGNCSCKGATKAHPTYTDGYYLFHFPLNINISFTCKEKPVDLDLSGRKSYNLIINNLIEKYRKSMTHKNDKNVEKSAVESFDKSVAGTEGIESIDIVENIGDVFMKPVSKKYKSKKQKHTNSVQIKEIMDTKSTDQTKGSLKYSRTDTNSKEILNEELDLKIEPMEYSEDEEGKLSANITEAEYDNALDNLRKEFSKFRNNLQLNPCAKKLECIDRLTKQFSETRMELMGVKSEQEYNFD